jgi:hypothetical protein
MIITTINKDMAKKKETLAEKQERISITRSAGNFLSEQPEGTLYGAYKELKQAQADGYGFTLADAYLVVWQPLENMTVDQILEVIENSAKGSDEPEMPEFIKKIGWEDLKGQKLVLLKLIDEIEKCKLPDAILTVPVEAAEALNGILHLIDSLQDYAVDECGLEENKVFDLHPDE